MSANTGLVGAGPRGPLRVVGLDISLTSTGMSDGRDTHVLQTSPDTPLEERLDFLMRGMVRYVLADGCELAVIEGPSYGSQGQGREALDALRIMMRHRLWCLHIPFALVAPSTLKKYTTGNGKATKKQMVAAVDERHHAGTAAFKVKDGRYDRADAFALAAMGLDHAGIGYRLPCHYPAPPPHRPSLLSVTWPEMASDG